MGLLAKYFEGEGSARTAADDALLLHGMMCIAGADGAFDQTEVALLEGYFTQLPEFRGKDFDALIAEARKIVAPYPSTLASVEALTELSTPALRNKMFVIAAEIGEPAREPSEWQTGILIADRNDKVTAGNVARVNLAPATPRQPSPRWRCRSSPSRSWPPTTGVRRRR